MAIDVGKLKASYELDTKGFSTGAAKVSKGFTTLKAGAASAFTALQVGAARASLAIQAMASRVIAAARSFISFRTVMIAATLAFAAMTMAVKKSISLYAEFEVALNRLGNVSDRSLGAMRKDILACLQNLEPLLN